MSEYISKSAFALIVILFSLTAATAQSPVSQECFGRVYNAKEVTRRAKIIQRPDLNLVNSFVQGRQAHIVIRGVLCRTGRVTDMQLIEGTPSELTDYLKKAVSGVTFTPAELNWHSVSQRMAFEFDINGGRTKMISEDEAKGRLVETVEVVGNRRLTAEQIMFWIKTRPGYAYDGDLVQTDLQVLLSKGYFDKLQTRVVTEGGPRGGIVVTFELFELPVIGDVKINGLSEGYSLVVGAKLALVGVDRGEPFDVAKVKLGTMAIKQFLESKGWRDVRVEETTENVNPFTVILTFSISGYKPQ